MKHILYFFDARKGFRIDLFSARSEICVVNFDLFVFIFKKSTIILELYFGMEILDFKLF